MTGLTALDIITLLLVGGGIVFGFMRGFVFEVLSLLAWVGAVVALKFGQPPVADWLEGVVGTESGAAVLAFAIVFGVALFGGKMIANRMGFATRRSVVGFVDRVLGAAKLGRRDQLHRARDLARVADRLDLPLDVPGARH